MTAIKSYNPAELRIDPQQLFQVLDRLRDAILIYSTSGEVLWCNEFMEQLASRPHDEIVGHGIGRVFDPVAPHVAKILMEAVEQGETLNEEIKVYDGHQKKVFVLYTAPILDKSGTVSDQVAVFQDITQIKQIEKVRRDFVANVSHELRTPLSAINGYTETLLEGALEDGTVSREFVQIIFNHSQRLSRLVQDLLDLSKLESDVSLELREVNLATVVDKTLELVRSGLTDKQLTLHRYIPDGLSRVLADESMVEQVVTNLVDNAVKYTPEGGAVSIRAYEVEGGFVQVDVEDTGIGIEAKHVPRIFERFYRVDKARSRAIGGTGLGLSIVKHIIQLHGGDVWVKSQPGVGTTFSFTLQQVKPFTA